METAWRPGLPWLVVSLLWSALFATDGLPSMMTTWGRWRSEHPETLVLNGRRAEGMMGAFNLNRDRGRYGLSVGHGTRVKLIRSRCCRATGS